MAISFAYIQEWAHSQSGQAISPLRAFSRVGCQTGDSPHTAPYGYHASCAGWCGPAHSEEDQRPQESEHGRTLQPPERHTHSISDGQAIRPLQVENFLKVSLAQLHRNYTFAPQKQKPATDELAGFSMPIRLASGSSTWARTRDLRINSPALYRLSYRGMYSVFSSKKHA